jgi:hypothetical protein
LIARVDRVGRDVGRLAESAIARSRPASGSVAASVLLGRRAHLTPPR